MPVREQPEKIDTKFVKGFFRRRKKVFLTVSSIFFSVAIVFAFFFSPKIYVSSATFLIEGHMPDEIVKGMSSGFIEERLQSITQQVLSREKLLELAWGYDFAGQTRTVDVHVAHLRNKLEGASATIETVWGVGYKLDKK